MLSLFCFQGSKIAGGDTMFKELIQKNCFSKDTTERNKAAAELERLYGCEINCMELDSSVLFAHHGRGCTIVAAKI